MLGIVYNTSTVPLEQFDIIISFKDLECKLGPNSEEINTNIMVQVFIVMMDESYTTQLIIVPLVITFQSLIPQVLKCKLLYSSTKNYIA